MLIGTTAADSRQGKRLIFLDSSDWVCAADLQSANTDQYVRHFFFPADWLSRSVDLMIEVTRDGNIILVKRDEVAVVKRGLLTSERVRVGTEKRKALLAQRID